MKTRILVTGSQGQLGLTLKDIFDLHQDDFSRIHAAYITTYISISYSKRWCPQGDYSSHRSSPPRGQRLRRCCLAMLRMARLEPGILIPL